MYDLWTRICFCCAILRDVIIVERCFMNIISTTCVLQNAVVCWVTAIIYANVHTIALLNTNPSKKTHLIKKTYPMMLALVISLASVLRHP